MAGWEKSLARCLSQVAEPAGKVASDAAERLSRLKGLLREAKRRGNDPKGLLDELDKLEKAKGTNPRVGDKPGDDLIRDQAKKRGDLASELSGLSPASKKEMIANRIEKLRGEVAENGGNIRNYLKKALAHKR